MGATTSAYPGWRWRTGFGDECQGNRGGDGWPIRAPCFQQRADGPVSPPPGRPGATWSWRRADGLRSRSPRPDRACREPPETPHGSPPGESRRPLPRLTPQQPRHPLPGAQAPLENIQKRPPDDLGRSVDWPSVLVDEGEGFHGHTGILAMLAPLGVLPAASGAGRLLGGLG